MQGKHAKLAADMTRDWSKQASAQRFEQGLRTCAGHVRFQAHLAPHVGHADRRGLSRSTSMGMFLDEARKWSRPRAARRTRGERRRGPEAGGARATSASRTTEPGHKGGTAPQGATARAAPVAARWTPGRGAAAVERATVGSRCDSAAFAGTEDQGVGGGGSLRGVGAGSLGGRAVRGTHVEGGRGRKRRDVVAVDDRPAA